MEVVVSPSPSLKSVKNCIEDLLEDHFELLNTCPTSLLPKELNSQMDKVLDSQDPDVMEAKKFFKSLFDPDSLKLNTSLILLVTKACGFDVTPNHQLLCESVQNYTLGHVFHAAMLNVKDYTPSSLLCNKVSTLIGDYFFSMATKIGAEIRFCPVYSLTVQAFVLSLEGKFVKLEDVDSWITKHSQEFAMDGYSLQSAVLLGDDKKKEEAEAAAEFGINFSLIRCMKKELQDFHRDKENNNIKRDSLPVFHAFAGREKQIQTTVHLLEEVVKMKGVEKTMMQMKDYQEKALKSLKIFATDPETCQVLENLVNAFVQADFDPLEKKTDSSMNFLMNFYTGLRTSTSNESLEVVKNLLLEITEASGPFKERMERLMEYNMTGLSFFGAHTIPYLFTQLNVQASKVDLFQAQIMGWLFAFVGVALFITDDIVDKSKSRSGKPCWYLLPEVGRTQAVLDSNIIVTCIPLAVKHFFGQHECYKEIAREINKFIVNGVIGQLVDTEDNQKEGSDDIDFERFTWDRFKDIVLNKTSGAEIVSMPCFLSGETNESVHRELRSLAAYCSLFVQSINDYHDVFPSDGAPGTDIEEGKLTWCILKALEKASPEQRNILEQNYGKRDKKCVRSVKKVFRELDLRQEFQDLELASKEDTEKLTTSLIQASQGSKLWGGKGFPIDMIKEGPSTFKKNYSLFMKMST